MRYQIDVHANGVTVTDTDGCSASNNITINLLAGLTPTINEIDSTICVGDERALIVTTNNGNGNFIYAWYENGVYIDETSSIIVNPLTTSQYTVNVTDSLGCTGNAVQNIIVSPTYSISLDMPSTICSGNEAIISIINTDNLIDYNWTENGLPLDINNASITVNPSSTSTYNVTVTDNNGCTAQTSNELLVNACTGCTVTDENADAGELTVDIIGSDGINLCYYGNTYYASMTIEDNNTNEDYIQGYIAVHDGIITVSGQTALGAPFVAAFSEIGEYCFYAVNYNNIYSTNFNGYESFADIDTCTIAISEPICFTINPLPSTPNTIISSCEDNEITITAIGDADALFTWNETITNNNLIVTNENIGTTYTLTQTTNNCTSEVLNITVEATWFDDCTVTCSAFAGEDTFICYEEIIQLAASLDENETGLWSVVDEDSSTYTNWFDDINLPNALFSLPSTITDTTYALVWTVSACSDTVTVTAHAALPSWSYNFGCVEIDTIDYITIIIETENPTNYSITNPNSDYYSNVPFTNDTLYFPWGGGYLSLENNNSANFTIKDTTTGCSVDLIAYPTNPGELNNLTDSYIICTDTSLNLVLTDTLSTPYNISSEFLYTLCDSSTLANGIISPLLSNTTDNFSITLNYFESGLLTYNTPYTFAAFYGNINYSTDPFNLNPTVCIYSSANPQTVTFIPCDNCCAAILTATTDTIALTAPATTYVVNCNSLINTAIVDNSCEDEFTISFDGIIVSDPTYTYNIDEIVTHDTLSYQICSNCAPDTCSNGLLVFNQAPQIIAAPSNIELLLGSANLNDTLCLTIFEPDSDAFTLTATTDTGIDLEIWNDTCFILPNNLFDNLDLTANAIYLQICDDFVSYNLCTYDTITLSTNNLCNILSTLPTSSITSNTISDEAISLNIDSLISNNFNAILNETGVSIDNFTLTMDTIYSNYTYTIDTLSNTLLFPDNNLNEYYLGYDTIYTNICVTNGSCCIRDTLFLEWRMPNMIFEMPDICSNGDLIPINIPAASSVGQSFFNTFHYTVPDLNIPFQGTNFDIETDTIGTFEVYLMPNPDNIIIHNYDPLAQAASTFTIYPPLVVTVETLENDTTCNTILSIQGGNPSIGYLFISDNDTLNLDCEWQDDQYICTDLPFTHDSLNLYIIDDNNTCDTSLNLKNCELPCQEFTLKHLYTDEHRCISSISVIGYNSLEELQNCALTLSCDSCTVAPFCEWNDLNNSYNCTVTTADYREETTITATDKTGYIDQLVLLNCQNEPQIKVAPNPFTDDFSIEVKGVPNHKHVYYLLYNNLGQYIHASFNYADNMSNNYAVRSMSVDLHEAPPGLYILQVIIIDDNSLYLEQDFSYRSILSSIKANDYQKSYKLIKVGTK